MASRRTPALPQPRHQALVRQPLGREEEEAQLARFEQAPRLVDLGIGAHRVQRRGGDAERAELAHLVAHQRDQRRDDERQPAVEDRRQLVADRLAAAGRHDREDVLAGEDPVDDLALAGPEIVVAEHRFQRRAGVRRASVTAARRPRLIASRPPRPRPPEARRSRGSRAGSRGPREQPAGARGKQHIGAVDRRQDHERDRHKLRIAERA